MLNLEFTKSPAHRQADKTNFSLPGFLATKIFPGQEEGVGTNISFLVLVYSHNKTIVLVYSHNKTIENFQ